MRMLTLSTAMAKEVLFFTVYSNHSIMRVDVDGSNAQVIVSGQPHVAWPDGVQVDTENGWLYWTNMGSAQGDCAVCTRGSVYRSRLDGSGTEVVVPADGPIGTGKQALLDRKRQHLYVGDKQPSSGTIWRVDVSAPPFPVTPVVARPASEAKEIYPRSTAGVCLDHTGERLLFTNDGHGGGIGVVSREIPGGMDAYNRTDVLRIYTNSTARPLLPGEGVSPADHPCDCVTDSRGNIYWSDTCAACGGGGISAGSVDGRNAWRELQSAAAVRSSFPVGVALSGDEQTLYYAAFGSTLHVLRMPGRLYKSSVSGGPQTLVWESDYAELTGVTVADVPEQYLV